MLVTTVIYLVLPPHLIPFPPPSKTTSDDGGFNGGFSAGTSAAHQDFLNNVDNDANSCPRDLSPAYCFGYHAGYSARMTAEKLSH